MYVCISSVLSLSHAQLFATLWTAARQASLSIAVCLPEFARMSMYTYCTLFPLHSVPFSCWVMFNSLQPHGLQHTRLSCPSPTPRAYSNSCISCWWYHHPTISSSVVPFSRLQSFPTSGSFPMSQFFALGGQSIGASASVSALPMNIQDWFPLGLTDWIFLLQEILKSPRVQGTLKSLLQHHSSKTSVLQCSAFFIVQLSHPYMTTGKIIALSRWTFVRK